MMKKILFTLLASFTLATVAQAAGDSATAPMAPPQRDWAHAGFNGTYDKASLQRGFQVYREVCATCHGLKRIAFRNLADIGFNEDEVKALAGEYSVPGTPDEYGEPTTRKAIPSDYIPGPYKNEQEARASNNGALPPDLSLITKARVGGEDYVHALIAFSGQPPADFADQMQDNMYYNPYFSGRQIAMAPPLSEDQVTFADGTPGTVEQMSHDLVSFLAWAAEPEADARKVLGFKVVAFLLVLVILTFLSYRRVARRVLGH